MIIALASIGAPVRPVPGTATVLADVGRRRIRTVRVPRSADISGNTCQVLFSTPPNCQAHHNHSTPLTVLSEKNFMKEETNLRRVIVEEQALIHHGQDLLIFRQIQLRDIRRLQKKKVEVFPWKNFL